MVYPAGQETHINVTPGVTEIVGEHVNFGYGLFGRIQDYAGYEDDAASAVGSLTAQIKQLQVEMETVFGIALWGGGD